MSTCDDNQTFSNLSTMFPLVHLQLASYHHPIDDDDDEDDDDPTV